MAFNFTPEKPVLNFGPRPRERYRSRRFLFWPTWAYRVVAPRVRARTLNVLQRAVMGLCRAGQYRAEEIAGHLSVHDDLAAFIILELQESGYLNENAEPTARGLRVLESDADESQEKVVGYVFQDPWTGDLWPRFTESLDYCELEYREDGFPSLLLGTTGAPRRISAYTVLPPDKVHPATPSAKSIVQAVARQRRGFRSMDEDDFDEERLGSFAATGAQIDQVSFVEEAPQPFFLMTYLYVPESEAEAIDWYACDPFGFGQSVRLRRRVETVRRDDPGLFNVVNKLVEKTFFESYEEQQGWHVSLQMKAEFEVDGRLTVNFRSHAAYNRVLEMESARQEVSLLGPECPKRKINDVLVAGRKVLEAVFSSLTSEHSRFSTIWKRVYVSRTDRKTGKQGRHPQRDSKVLEGIYKGAFRSLGFSEPFPGRFLNIRAGSIKSVSQYQNSWSLGPLVTATALLAQRDSSHPLAEAARTSPELLNILDEIMHAGGGAAHDNDASFSCEEAEQIVEKIYEIISVLLEGANAEVQTPNERTGGSHG